MSLHPIDGETRADILGDLRKRRGPFAQSIVAVHEIVAHYTVARIKTTQARALLREVCAREVNVGGGRGQPGIRLFVVTADPQITALSVREVHAAYRIARGLPVPDAPAPRPSRMKEQPPGPGRSGYRQEKLRAELMAAFGTRSGPFASPLVTTSDLVAHYADLPDHTAAIFLGKQSYRARKASVSKTAGVMKIYVVHNSPRYQSMSPRELLLEYLKSKCL